MATELLRIKNAIILVWSVNQNTQKANQKSQSGIPTSSACLKVLATDAMPSSKACRATRVSPVQTS
eukprot:1517665-Amphidinium_carterae.1